MQRHRCGILAALTIALTATAAQAGQFVTIDMPGSGTAANTGTQIAAINAKNVVTGAYVTNDLAVHGFVGNVGGPYTIIDAPGAGTGARQGTSAVAINNKGTIAGTEVSDAGYFGFIRDAQGNFTTFDAGGTKQTIVWAINSKGAITGWAGQQSFVRSKNGKIKLFQAANAKATYAAGINTAGVIAGYYKDSSGLYHAFLRAHDGSITTIDVDGYYNTQATAIDDNGDIVGSATMGGTVSAMLRTSNGTISIFIPSGCRAAYAESINASGAITGTCYDDNYIRHGFVRQPDGSMSIFDAPGAGSTSPQGTFPSVIAADGKIVGYYVDANNANHGFRRNAGN
ncbi:MAG TPA: hypothetical protein VMF58_13970 [Rhizomicrobium sp.]|nr:hypothetical protein [Rhizomicrobium sp.]